LSNRVIKGEHSYGDVKVPWGGRVTIGKYCSIAGGVIAAILSDHRMDWVSTYPFAVRWGSKIEGRSGSRQNPDVIVENDVWIGLGTVLLENTHLRNGSVVGSYSVVHGEVPPYCIAVGNPANDLNRVYYIDFLWRSNGLWADGVEYPDLVSAYYRTAAVLDISLTVTRADPGAQAGQRIAQSAHMMRRVKLRNLLREIRYAED